MNKDEQILHALIDLARNNPGQAVGLVAVGHDVLMGVMNIVPDTDDWFYQPIFLGSGESIGGGHKKQNPLTERVSESEPGGTRTLNQLIKRQSKARKPRRKGGEDAA